MRLSDDSMIHRFLGRWFVAVGLASSLAASANAADVTIRVNTAEPSHRISPRLIGVFFEDINFGADGGLSAELVKNGSFDIGPSLMGWKTEGEGLSVTVERDASLSAANPSYLRLRGEGQGAIVNSGYRGIGVHADAPLFIGFYGRSEADKSAELTATLVAEDGTKLAEERFKIEGSDWRRHESKITPTKTFAKARLEFRISGAGPVDLDVVSLSPVATWRDRPRGLRRDIVELLADLKPAFFRFPGGCIVEGSQLKNRYQWKTTIGPPEERRSLVNRWNTEFAHRLTPDYYQSFALGFFEYFQLSEDIGAEPLPIISCGMACQFNSGELVPLEELQPYIQDALDLIEFANGPIDSEWGAKRAAMGHPEPFNLRLLGVGNEQWGPEYFERYERFAEVLQREHPEIELVSTSGPFPSGRHFDHAWPLLRKLGVPIVDEHCYAMPDWFLREAHRFDGYDRKGPQVFMGEYAAQSVQIASPQNRNNLRCAIAEAAFLTGVERNSDIVTMSAYAPLLAHEEAWQWRPNLIWFDNLSSYATPSYHVQKLFSHHRGDVSLPTQIEDTRPVPPIAGRFGVGSHQTAVEFRNIRIANGDNDDTEALKLGDKDLTIRDGAWTATEGLLRNGSEHGSSRTLVGPRVEGDATLTLQARKVKGREGFVVYIRCGDGGSLIEWNVGGWGNREHGLTGHLATHSETPIHFERKPGSIDEGRWYDVKVSIEGSRVRCYLDGKLVHDIDAPAPKIDRVFAVASRDEESGDTILKVVNPTDEAADIRLELSGARSGDAVCRVIQLSGEPDAENSIEYPKRVAPQESEATIRPTDDTRTFPPHSLTVLRIAKAKGAP
jgi:alpha-N-arabinofuranosidase